MKIGGEYGFDVNSSKLRKAEIHGKMYNKRSRGITK